MTDINVKKLNYCTTEVEVEGKKFLLIDNRVKAARRRKVCDAIINTVLVIAFGALMLWEIWLFFTYDEGHWEADYVNEEGQFIDIDGDGDCYHWVDPVN